MKNVLVFAFIISSFGAHAQAPVTKKVISRPPASATAAAVTPSGSRTGQPVASTAQISIEEEAQRILYAKELMNVMDVNKTIVQSLEEADLYFQRPIDIEKDEKKSDPMKKALVAGKIKYDTYKSKLPQQINDQLVKDLSQRYSSIELKYLIEITKYPLYKKFRAYIESDEYFGLIGRPYSEAQNAVNEAKRTIASEPSSTAKPAKRK
ncbi:MAG: hypothetical protein H7256_01785 [Bdellovibrio sp.]|nr:hypothetical protein [Bdellovibrio sp.]